MKPTIKKLWNSDISSDGDTEHQQELLNIKQQKAKLMRVLAEKTDDECYKLLMDYAELDRQYLSICCENAFERGFSLGTKLTAEVFTNEKNN